MKNNDIEKIKESAKGISESLRLLAQQLDEFISMIDADDNTESKEDQFYYNEEPEIVTFDYVTYREELERQSRAKAEEERQRKEKEVAISNRIEDEYKSITEAFKELEEKSCRIYFTDKEPSASITNARISFEDFKKRQVKHLLDEQVKYDSSLKTKSLISELGIYGWANIIIRIWAYASIEKFKFPDIKNELDILKNNIEKLYGDNNVDIKIPQLLVEIFDEDKHVFNNDNQAIVDIFCDLNRNDYLDTKKLYDLIRIGYSYISNDVVLNEKPIVKYY